MSIFKVTPHGPYGYRIWVDSSRDLTDVWEDLKTLSKWKGSDKEDGKWKAFEFDFIHYTKAVMILNENYYQLGEE